MKSGHSPVPAKTGLNWFKLYAAGPFGCARYHNSKRPAGRAVVIDQFTWQTQLESHSYFENVFIPYRKLSSFLNLYIYIYTHTI